MDLSYLQMKLYHRDTGGNDDRGNHGLTDGDALDIRFKKPPEKGALLKRAQNNHTISSWRRNSSLRI